jgi:hypothetical protein
MVRIGDVKRRPGPVTRAIQQAFFAATCGRDPRHLDWLAPVRESAAVAA